MKTTQNQYSLPATDLTKFQRLLDGRYAEKPDPLPRQDARHGLHAVAVGVGLDHGQDLGPAGPQIRPY